MSNYVVNSESTMIIPPPQSNVNLKLIPGLKKLKRCPCCKQHDLIHVRHKGIDHYVCPQCDIRGTA